MVTGSGDHLKLVAVGDDEGVSRNGHDVRASCRRRWAKRMGRSGPSMKRAPAMEPSFCRVTTVARSS